MRDARWLWWAGFALMVGAVGVALLPPPFNWWAPFSVCGVALVSLGYRGFGWVAGYQAACDGLAVHVQLSQPVSWQQASEAVYGPLDGPAVARLVDLINTERDAGTLALITVYDLRAEPTR